jgi:hypothetical protein
MRLYLRFRSNARWSFPLAGLTGRISLAAWVIGVAAMEAAGDFYQPEG